MVLEMVLVLPLAANRDSPPVPFVIPSIDFFVKELKEVERIRSVMVQFPNDPPVVPNLFGHIDFHVTGLLNRLLIHKLVE